MAKVNMVRDILNFGSSNLNSKSNYYCLRLSQATVEVMEVTIMATTVCMLEFV